MPICGSVMLDAQVISRRSLIVSMKHQPDTVTELEKQKQTNPALSKQDSLHPTGQGYVPKTFPWLYDSGCRLRLWRTTNCLLTQASTHRPQLRMKHRLRDATFVGGGASHTTVGRPNFPQPLGMGLRLPRRGIRA